MTTGTQWELGPDLRVIYQPQDEFDPPRLLIGDASHSVLLMPPSDRTRYAEFRRFLADLASAATELASDFHLAEQPRRL